MKDAPTDPFTLIAHLEDEHEVPSYMLERMAADDLRDLHRHKHHDGPCGHDHPYPLP
jgi:hypothetical protein